MAFFAYLNWVNDDLIYDYAQGYPNNANIQVNIIKHVSDFVKKPHAFI